jgi:hypothetical protein
MAMMKTASIDASGFAKEMQCCLKNHCGPASRLRRLNDSTPEVRRVSSTLLLSLNSEFSQKITAQKMSWTLGGAFQSNEYRDLKELITFYLGVK